MRFKTASLLLLASKFCLADDQISHPLLDFADFGGQIGVFGSFSSLSFYDYANASAFLSPSDSSQSLYLRNISSGASSKIASVSGGSVSLLQQIGVDSVLVSGDFSTFNDEDYTPPIIYNVSSGDVVAIFSSLAKRDQTISGSVKTTLVDGELIYMGGDFEYNNTYGAAVYNITSKTVSSLPFRGFGQNSSVNAIAKYSDDNSAESIIFGGSFDSLGLPELLMHNITLNSTSQNHTNSTNTSLISAEQVISLKHASFTNINAASNGADLTCPGLSIWSLQPASGGQWVASLPLEMRGLYPTKVRLTVPDSGEDGVKTFRIYTYPNNGIMNLTYVDPETNELAYCDSACPLLQASTLKEHVNNNIEDEEDITDPEGGIFVNKDGSFAMYFDESTNSKNLGYGSNYQEFAFINQVGVDLVGLTVTDWYGSKGALAGFELYLNSIRVYGNDTLNESNCGDQSTHDLNAAEIISGDWKSVQDLTDGVTDTSYMVSIGNSSQEIVLYPNISYSGDYSVLLYTPGCSADGSCQKRSIVNVTFSDVNDTVLASSLIYQNNLEQKFDYLFYGHLEGSSTNEGRNKIKIQYHSPIDPSVSDPWMVIDKVVANIVSLDDYYSSNSTNSTHNSNVTKHNIEKIYLNGLFEYSIANFSDFEESLVYSKSGDGIEIKKTNVFVGNSSLNELSGKLSSDTNITQMILQNSSDSSNLLLLGKLESKNVSLLNDNLITLQIKGYNSTSNSTEATLKTRLLMRRDVEISGLKFNNTISSISDTNTGYVALGSFSATGENIKDLSNSNKTVSSANNFALNINGEWYSFGNEYISKDYTQFASVELDGHEYFVFSTSDGDYKVWDNTDMEWPMESNLDISTSLTLEKRNQQILGGSSFGTMDYEGKNQAYFTNNSDFSSLGFNFTDGQVSTSFFVNDTFSVIGGKFQANLSIKNMAMVKKNIGYPIGDFKWDDDAGVSVLYVDNNAEFLFIGTNGSVDTSSSNVTGLLVFDLNNSTAASVQPASLSTNDDKNLLVNAMVFYDNNNQLLVGGNFATAGSLDCAAACIYDIPNTRWVNPATNDNSLSIGGSINDAKFMSSREVLLAGNITLNGNGANFAIYDFGTGSFEDAGKTVNDIGISNDAIKKFIINDRVDNDLDFRMVAFGSGFVAGFDGNKWAKVDSAIDYSDETDFQDLKLVELKNPISSNSRQSYFDKDKAVVLSGTFNISKYGLVNAAIYDGNSWIPYIFSQDLNAKVGSINTLLLEEVYRFQSSSDLKKGKSKLSTGKVVGISLACAIGSTFFLGLLYFIPLLYLFKSSEKSENVNQRIHEDEMMHAVRPEDLFHEIDLHRNT